MTGGWWVYTHISPTGDALYVGCTKRLRQRQAEHRGRSDWWPVVDDVAALGPFASKPDALDLERHLIGELQPPHNLLRTDRERGFYSAAFRADRIAKARRRSAAA